MEREGVMEEAQGERVNKQIDEADEWSATMTGDLLGMTEKKGRKRAEGHKTGHKSHSYPHLLLSFSPPLLWSRLSTCALCFKQHFQAPN